VGSGTLVGSTFLAKAKLDGHAIGLNFSAISATTPFLARLDFDPSYAFAPSLQQSVCLDQSLGVPTNSPIRTFKDLMEEGCSRNLQRYPGRTLDY
jgi:hypothetical protein